MGDEVVLSENADSVVEILPRKNEFIRPPVANIDQMVVVTSVISPAIDYLMIDSLIINIEARGLEAVVCINKSDINGEDECKKVAGIYNKAGYKTVITSASTGQGREELGQILKDKTTAFSGSSGVGKSSLLNLIDSEFMLETGSVSRKLERGKHTTRHVELFPLRDGGYVLDTPGFAKTDLPPITTAELSGLFREMAQRSDECRFKGCAHIFEPSCAVREAIENGEISQSRYESYKYFYEKLKDVKEWNKSKKIY